MILAPAVAQQLEALKRDYRQRNLQRIEQLIAQAAPASPDFAAELEVELHKLAGSGGSFGFAELSQRARGLEQQLRLARERGAGFDGSLWRDRLRRLADCLREAVPTVAVTPPTAHGDDAPIYLFQQQAEPHRGLFVTLSQFGYAVQALTSSTALHEALGRRVPQALLVELDERSTGGVFDTVNALRAEFALHDCPVLYLAATDSMALRLAAVRAGARGFFLRPYDPMRLIARLDWLRQQRQAARYRVLLVDDDALLATHVARVLDAGGFEVDTLNDPCQALERLDAFRPDLILLDMYMPGCSGPELARVIRMKDEWLATPIVFLSAETDASRLLALGSDGADDFLSKPLDDLHLIAAVRTRCERARQMAELINRDSLTGLLKHSRIKEQLLAEVGRAQRLGQSLCVAMLDLDHFKQVNDRYGHPVGDQVIRALATLLRQRVRGSDSVGRYGGEEFLLVLPNCSADNAVLLLNDICQRFKALEFHADGQAFRVTLSAGIASSAQFAQAGELIAQADQALYQAKAAGRDRVELA